MDSEHNSDQKTVVKVALLLVTLSLGAMSLAAIARPADPPQPHPAPQVHPVVYAKPTKHDQHPCPWVKRATDLVISFSTRLTS